MEDKNQIISALGKVHVYTGNGKGKTTAALGLAFRAMGSGLRTYIGQFMKGLPYGELESAKMVAPFITIEQFGSERLICLGEKDPMDVKRAEMGLTKISEAVNSGGYQIVVLDEVCTAIQFGLLDVEAVVEVVKSRPGNLELVLTGRSAPKEIIDAADLVTEMLEVKHYYSSGLRARKGIEM